MGRRRIVDTDPADEPAQFGRRGQRLEVRVHPDDLGTVIGRGGRTAKALRQVITSIGGRGVRVDIVDAY